MNWRYRAGCAEVEQLARAICGDEQDAALLVQARIIAENELLLRAIRLQKLASIERVMTEVRLSKSVYVQQTEARKLEKELLDHVDSPRMRRERDEYQALELAAPDLDALERYETRAWSRQMRAIREFIDIRRSAES